MASRVPRAAAGVAVAVGVWCAGASQADAIRVDDQWYQNVYIQESAQFYRVLIPETGEARNISKKRQDVSEPRLSKDEAEREALRARWEQAAKEREAVDARDIEIRVRSQAVTNLENGQRPERRKLSPQELAARQAEWEATLLQRQQLMEERERMRAERFGEPIPEEEPYVDENMDAQPVAPVETPEQGEALTPPGPREQPQTRPQSAEEVYSEEMQRLQADPYTAGSDVPMTDAQAQEELERMQAEAYYWQQMEAQGYLDAIGYTAPGMTPATPLGR